MRYQFAESSFFLIFRFLTNVEQLKKGQDLILLQILKFLLCLIQYWHSLGYYRLEKNVYGSAHLVSVGKYLKPIWNFTFIDSLLTKCLLHIASGYRYVKSYFELIQEDRFNWLFLSLHWKTKINSENKTVNRNQQNKIHSLKWFII